MLTIVDKVLFLQNVDIFNHSTTEELAFIGSIAREVEKPLDSVIFKEDESSDAMYLVVKGRVRLHKGDNEILVVGEREAFGTWALFDNEPRLMTATAIEDVHLLKIEQEEFYDLLSDHIEITQSIFRALVDRIKRLIGNN
jgi:CRP/FNR family transcriptional regulator, cyclic AMP receptor protein